ncbi:MAG: peptide-modifying radical SAM enzyme CbpB [Candidatus Omnitrophica bacterium]|nr:peptide-modifying radical SAM enzyme CbpB [Candidatus Omnitrophota bacterium]
MAKGLDIWENNDRSVIVDADSLFWAQVKKSSKDSIFIPEDVLALYQRHKNGLLKRMNDFRLSQELTAIYIDPTDKCNASCAYCYLSVKSRKSGRSMTYVELDFILNKLARYFKGSVKKQVIIFHASEPLLVKDIIFQAIKKYKNTFKFGLQTNALLLEKKDVDFLKENLVGVGISLDSHRPSVNQRQRPSELQGSNFAQAVKALDWFNGYNGLNVIATVTKYNVKDLPGLVRFLHKKKVPCVLLNPVRFTRVPVSLLKPNENDFAKYFIQAVETAVKLTSNTGHKIIVGNFANTILAIVAPQARRLMCDLSPCGGGRCFFTITAKGEMVPCGEFSGIKGFSGGNIFRDSIDKAMRSPAFVSVRSRTVEKITECAQCVLRNICGAPCPAELHSLGNMYQKSVFCDFYKQVIQYAFKMIAQGKLEYLLRDEPLNNLKYEYNLQKQGRVEGKENG